MLSMIGRYSKKKWCFSDVIAVKTTSTITLSTIKLVSVFKCYWKTGWYWSIESNVFLPIVNYQRIKVPVFCVHLSSLIVALVFSSISFRSNLLPHIRKLSYNHFKVWKHHVRVLVTIFNFFPQHFVTFKAVQKIYLPNSSIKTTSLSARGTGPQSSRTYASILELSVATILERLLSRQQA